MSNQTVYQFGRSKFRTVKLSPISIPGLAPAFEIEVIDDGLMLNSRGFIPFVKDYISSVMFVGGSSWDKTKTKMKLISGNDVLGVLE